MNETVIHILNLLIPGAGLIARRREWLGFLLSLLFGICANLGLASWLIAPDAFPAWLSIAALVLAAVTWILAQALFHLQQPAPSSDLSPVAGQARNID